MKWATKGRDAPNDLDTARRRMLAGFLDAFVAWQMGQILRDLFEELPGNLGLILLIATLLGVAGFFWYGYKLMKLQQKAKSDPAIAASLDDERVRALRREAFSVSFWVLLVYVAFMRLLDLVGMIHDHGPFWQLGIVIGVSAAIGYYLWKERRDDE